MTNGGHVRAAGRDSVFGSRDKWYRYFTPSDVHRQQGLYCVGVGSKSGALPAIDDRALPCYGAIFVVEGHGWFESPRAPGRHPVQAPAVLWLFPGVPHSYAPDDSGWTEHWILFGGTAPRSYEELGYLSRDEPVQSLTTPSFRETFDSAIEHCTTPSPHGLTEAAVTVHQLIVAAGHQRNTGAAEPDHRKLVDRLREHACLPLSVADHARRLGVSVAALRAAVHEAGIDGPKELILQTRIAHAQSLLGESAMPVRSVARQVGYHDPAYFTRLFTQRVGISPSSFRHARRVVGVHARTGMR